VAIRKTSLVNGEHYHVFNRGVDKRDIFLDRNDIDRFFQSMAEFNVTEPIGSLFKNSFGDHRDSSKEKLVNIVCFCLNPNHYHFILEQLVDDGVGKFMQKMGGYPKFFNTKYKRSGALFQGKFKAVHISTNEQLLHVSAYVNLNNLVHGSLRSKAPQLSMSSWGEYTGDSPGDFCKKDIILEQFKNNTEYKTFAEESLKSIREKRELDELLLEPG
jgi:putative transposase